MLKQPFLYFFLCLFFTLPSSEGQNYSHRRFTLKDGLVQMQVMTIYQDSRGYIWLGTKGGVSKFNGETFENFRTQDGLIYRHIRSIIEDRKGNIWFGSSKGLSKYDGKKMTAFPFENLSSKLVSQLAVDKENNIWIRRASHSQHTLKFDGQQYHIIKDKERSRRIFSTGIYFDESTDNIILPIDSLGIAEVSNDTIIPIDKMQLGNFDLYFDRQLNQLRINESAPEIDSRFLYKKGKLNSLFSYDKKRGTFFNVNYSLLEKDYFFFYKHKLWRINKSKERIEQITIPKVTSYQSILLDKDNNLWIGSDEGLIQLWTKGFEHFGTDEFANTWNLVEDKDNKLWFAGYNTKLKVFDGEQVKELNNYENTIGFPKLHKHFYFGGLKDSHDNLLFPLQENILRYDGKAFSTIKSHGYNNKTNLYIWEDKEDDLVLAGVREGVNIIKDYEVIAYYGKEKGMHQCSYIVSINEDKTGKYWLGSFAGLSRLNLATGQIENYTQAENKLPSRGVISMVKDAKENMWFGSMNGLLTYDYQKDSIYNVSPELNTPISFVIDIDESHLMLGAAEGLYVLDLDRYYAEGKANYKYFNYRNGFLGIEPTQNTFLKDSKGDIWIASVSSVDKFNPKDLDYTIPTVNSRITHINKEKIAFQTSKINLPEGENALEFRFEGIGVERPLNTQYAYKLEGLDSDWSAWREDDFAVYTNLGSGNYTFKVKSRIGSYSEVEPTVSKLDIGINLPFWKEPDFFKTAFTVLGIISALLVSFMLGTYFFRSKAKEKEQEAAAQKRKSQYLQVQTSLAQMNPHFIFNVLQSMQGLIISEDWRKADEYLVQLSKLIRRFLEASVSSDMTNGDNPPDVFTLEQEIDLLNAYISLEQKLPKNSFEYEINSNGIDIANYDIPPMLIQPYVENAIKHGLNYKKSGEKKLWINFALDENEDLLCTIEDTGVGRAAAKVIQTTSYKPYQSQGTKLVEKRVQLLNESGYNITIETVDRPEEGTVINLKIAGFYEN